MYDGFVSYSHAADGLLAPRLQAGLQRFAKPWWQRRALRIFRDESSLSANPHLWESIVEAMDDSEWLVLLLSPEAAESEWVNREIEYWKSHKEQSRILPVVTDGSFAWRAGEVSGSAVPPALRGVFGGEPRWVDMRFAHSDEHLDLKNPEFLDAVADIASALHGVPKDELASEEVKQHRRTVRTAWAAGVALLALTVFSVVVAVFARDQQREADAARADAERQAEIARDNEKQARDAEAEALRQAAIVESRRLLTRSALVVEEDAELAALLALYALMSAPDSERRVEAQLALRDALEENRLLKRFPVGPGRHLAAISPDGRTIYHWSEHEASLKWIDVESESVVHSEPVQGVVNSLGVDPLGELVALSINGGDSGPARSLLFDVDSGDVQTLPHDGCDIVWWPMNGGFSPDGAFFSVPLRACGESDSARAVVYDRATWKTDFVYTLEGAEIEKIAFSADSARMLQYGWDGERNWGTAEVVSYPDRTPVFVSEEPVLFVALSPRGDKLVYDANSTQVRLVDLDSGEIEGYFAVDLLSEVPRCCDPIRFSPDGRWVSVILDDRTDVVLDVDEGGIEFWLYEHGDTVDHSWSGDSNLLLTTHADSLILWAIRLSPERISEVFGTHDPVGLAFDLLTRGFSAGDCHSHSLSECPTLDEMRAELEDTG